MADDGPARATAPPLASSPATKNCPIKRFTLDHSLRRISVAHARGRRGAVALIGSDRPGRRSTTERRRRGSGSRRRVELWSSRFPRPVRCRRQWLGSVRGEEVPVSFVPLTGPATLHAAEVPREARVEFTDTSTPSRCITLPIRAALPVLAKARSSEEAHPSVALLAAASLLAMRFVAAGRFEPGPGSWRVSLQRDDVDTLQTLAASRSYAGMPADAAETVVRRLVDAVVDAMPRSAPSTASSRLTPSGPRGRPRDDAFTRRLQDLVTRHRQERSDLPQLVTLSLRVEADEEELVARACRMVLQVHDERDPIHVRNAASLWQDPPTVHGFGDRARTHAILALRDAAAAWPPLERLLEQRVPDELTLDSEELVSLLEDGVGTLRATGVDVLWPRSLGRT